MVSSSKTNLIQYSNKRICNNIVGAKLNKLQAKILDWDSYSNGSFADDLIRFLLACGSVDDLKVNFESFIEYYYTEFTKTLTMTNIPLDDFTYDK